MSSIFIFGVTAAVAAVVLIAGYYILRHRRGSVQLTLAQRSFRPGEKFKGSLRMTTRGDIEGNRLYAALIGEEVTRESYVGSGSRRPGPRTHTREIYRDEHVIEAGVTYRAGQVIEREFELTAPPSSVLGGIASSRGRTLELDSLSFSGSGAKLRWTVAVCLDAKGIDLAAGEKVDINTFPEREVI